MHNPNHKLISVMITIYNEELNIATLYDRVSAVMKSLKQNYELIFVNDCSKDSSLFLIKQLALKDSCVKFIDFSRNFGHQIAVSAGLEYSSGDFVAIIDADLQDPPELISDLYQKINQDYDVVYAKRRSRKDKNILKKMAYKVFYQLLSVISQVNIPLDTEDFRMIRRNVVDQLIKMPEQNKFLRGQIAWLGFNQTLSNMTEMPGQLENPDILIANYSVWPWMASSHFRICPSDWLQYRGFWFSFFP